MILIKVKNILSITIRSNWFQYIFKKSVYTTKKACGYNSLGYDHESLTIINLSKELKHSHHKTISSTIFWNQY